MTRLHGLNQPGNGYADTPERLYLWPAVRVPPRRVNFPDDIAGCLDKGNPRVFCSIILIGERSKKIRPEGLIRWKECPGQPHP